MKIILDEKESDEWLTMKHPCKCANTKLVHLTKEQKERVRELHKAGQSINEIKTTTCINGRQINGIIAGYKKPILANIHKGKTVLSPAIKAICYACHGELRNDRVAIDGKIYCSPACTPSKVPVMVTKRPTKEIDEELLELIADRSGESADHLAAYLGSHHGYLGMTPGKIVYLRGILTKRRNALGSHVEPKDEGKAPKVVEPQIKPESPPTGKLSKIDATILAMAGDGRAYLDIANYINAHTMQHWQSDDIAARLKKLREGSKQ